MSVKGRTKIVWEESSSDETAKPKHSRTSTKKKIEWETTATPVKRSRKRIKTVVSFNEGEKKNKITHNQDTHYRSRPEIQDPFDVIPKLVPGCLVMLNHPIFLLHPHQAFSHVQEKHLSEHPFDFVSGDRSIYQQEPFCGTFALGMYLYTLEFNEVSSAESRVVKLQHRPVFLFEGRQISLYSMSMLQVV